MFVCLFFPLALKIGIGQMVLYYFYIYLSWSVVGGIILTHLLIFTYSHVARPSGWRLKVWNPWQLSLAKARPWGRLTDMSNNQFQKESIRGRKRIWLTDKPLISVLLLMFWLYCFSVQFVIFWQNIQFIHKLHYSAELCTFILDNILFH